MDAIVIIAIPLGLVALILVIVIEGARARRRRRVQREHFDRVILNRDPQPRVLFDGIGQRRPLHHPRSHHKSP